MQDYRTLIENQKDILFTLSPKGIVTYCSPAVKNFGGYDPKAAVGSHMSKYFADKKDLKLARRALSQVEMKRRSLMFELLYKPKNKSPFYVEVSLAPVVESGKVVSINCVMRDISERKQYEELTKSQLDLTLKLASITNLNEAFECCLESAIKISGMDCGGLYVVDEYRALTLSKHVGFHSIKFVISIARYPAESPNSKLVLQKKPVYGQIKDLPKAARKSLLEEGLRCIAVLPVIHENEVIGCLNLSSHKLENIPENRRTALESIAALMGGAVLRIQAEEKLKQSEQKYRNLYNNLKDGFVTVDMKGKIIDCNQAYADIIGYTKKEAMKLTYRQLTPKKWQDFESRIVKQEVLKKGFSREYEKEYIRKDGSIVPISLRTILTRDQGGQPVGMYAIIRDITQPRKAESALRESQETLRKILDASSDGVVVLGLGGNIIDCNEAILEMYGFKTKKEVIGKELMRLVAPEARAAARKSFAGTRGSRQSIETTAVRKDGTRFSVDVTTTSVVDARGTPQSIVATVRDVTSRRKWEERLKQSEIRYRTIVENVTDALLIHDLEGKILDVNEVTCKMMGYQKKELIGQNLRKLDNAENARLALKRIGMLKKLGKLIFEGEWVSKHGIHIPVSISVKMVSKAGHGVAQAFIRDMTSQRKVAERLRRSEGQLKIQIEKMPIACLLMDSQFIIQTWNNAAERIFGFSAKDAIGRHPYEIIVPNKIRQTTDVIIKNLFKGKSIIKSTNDNITKDGRTITCNWTNTPLRVADGKVTGILSMAEDVTENNKTEEALRESENKYRSIVDNINIGVALIGKKMNVLSLNTKMKEWFPKANASGECICYRVFNNPPKKEICNWCPTAKTLQDGKVHESITDTPSGNQIRHYRVVSSPVIDRQGKVESAIEMVEDITEQRKAERQIKERNEELEKFNSLTVGRELKMIELKNKIAELEKMQK